MVDRNQTLEARDPGTSSATPHSSTSLYVSPVRGALVILLFTVLGLALILLPFVQAGSGRGASATPSAAIVTLILLFSGGLLLFPAVQFARLIVSSSPLVSATRERVERIRFGFGQTSIDWKNVGEISIKGVWIILVDGRIQQSRFRRSMLGTKGLWIPAIAVHGGGEAVIKFIETYRSDLIEHLVLKVASGRAGRGQ